MSVSSQERWMTDAADKKASSLHKKQKAPSFILFPLP